MSLPLHIRQCPAGLAHLIRIDFEIGGWWPYSCCFVRCCLQDLFNTAHSISAAWKKLYFILSDRSDFHLCDSLSIAFQAFTSYLLISFSVDEMLLPR